MPNHNSSTTPHIDVPSDSILVFNQKIFTFRKATGYLVDLLGGKRRFDLVSTVVGDFGRRQPSKKNLRPGPDIARVRDVVGLSHRIRHEIVGSASIPNQIGIIQINHPQGVGKLMHYDVESRNLCALQVSIGTCGSVVSI
jgi:hypothetical protein